MVPNKKTSYKSAPYKNIKRTPHPLIGKYKKMFYEEEENPPNPNQIDRDYLDLI